MTNLNQDDQEMVLETQASPKTKSLNSLKPQEAILIVDDEVKVRKIFKSLLDDAGYQVKLAESAELATEILLKQEFDLILLDIRMPNVNGVFMKEVIEDFDRKHKVMISSVYPLSEQKKKIPNADAYFDKSQGAYVLLEKIRALLDKK